MNVKKKIVYKYNRSVVSGQKTLHTRGGQLCEHVVIFITAAQNMIFLDWRFHKLVFFYGNRVEFQCK